MPYTVGMRQIYTSPRPENAERLSALFTEHGIENRIQNSSRWNRPSYERASYSRQHTERDSWPQVWVVRPDDYTRARELLNELGLEQGTRFAAELAQLRRAPGGGRADVPQRARRIALLAIAAIFVIAIVHYAHIV
ncbi:putative signal transducing protein [Frateuria aurantia]